MIYDLETMHEADLLQAILEIDSRMYEHFVDKDGVDKRLKLLESNKERERLLHVLEEAGLSPEEVVNLLSSNATAESQEQSEVNSPYGVKVVDVPDSQRQVIEANLKREQERQKNRMQALLDKYNIK